jgi:hypothetical protein
MGEDSPPFIKRFFCRPETDRSGAGSQHGAGDVEQAIGDRAQGASVIVTAASQRSVFSAAFGVVLHGDACPVVHGVGKARIAGITSEHDPAFARAPGDGRNPCQTAQSGVISSPQRIGTFCKQRGEDDPSHSHQGCEDLHVTLLLLPRLGLVGLGESGGQDVDLAHRLLELLVHEADGLNQDCDVGAGGLSGAGGQAQGLCAQCLEHVCGVEAADAMALEQLIDRGLAKPRSPVCRGYELQQLEQPLCPEVGVELEDGGKVAPELVAHAICETRAFGRELIGDARPFAQFDHGRIGGRQPAQAARIGPQCRGHHLGVSAVVLGAGHGEAVAEAIHLLRVDGVNLEAPFHQRLDHRAVRHLDRDQHLGSFARAACRHQPSRHVGQAFTAMLEPLLADLVTLGISEEHKMAFRRPVDAGVPLLLIGHAVSSIERTSHRNHRRSLYWRSEHVRRGLPTGRRLRPIRRGTRPHQVLCARGLLWLLPTDRLGSRRIADWLMPQIALRAASRHFTRPAALLPRTAQEGYRGSLEDTPHPIECAERSA